LIPNKEASVANTYPGRLIGRGSHGEFVKAIQKKLNVEVDGDFGPNTERAVKTFQRSHNLYADGIVGPSTWKVLFHPSPAPSGKVKLEMPVETNMAGNTNGWTGPNGHDGIDLICDPNASVFAACKSKVVRVSSSGWWGNNPQASHGHPISDGDGIIILESLVDAGPIQKGMHFCYGHAEGASVKQGETVEAGQRIGHAGFARAWHVHFMLNMNSPVNGFYRGVGDRNPRPVLDYIKDHS
jgi:murein DD-endopeptidase MepM/ murein hydrolase activator NlpD